MAHYRIPGVSIAFIHDYRIEWAKGCGVARAESEIPITPETVFQAASSTKLLTAMVALRYVETRLLDLDRDVNEYLKTWQVPDTDATGKEKVTLRRLLTHQSGLNRPDGGFSSEPGGSPSLVQILNGETPAKNQAACLDFVPGSEWQYSNMGFVLIQLILEERLDRPFTQIVEEEVLEPVEMKSSSITYPLPASLSDREAMPHDVEGRPGNPELTPTAVAHGGLMTTPSDFARLAIELMLAYGGRSERILSQETAHQMLQPNLEMGPEVFGFPFAYGLGTMLRGEGEQRSFLHPGSNSPGTTCWIEGFHGSGTGVAIMANGARGDYLALELVPVVLGGEYDLWGAS
jgi:CubicO group peptidase (beta-lactamase class C family)